MPNLPDQNDVLAQVTSLNESLAAANQEKATFQGRVIALETEKAALETDKANLTQQVTALTGERDTLKGENATLKAENEKLQGDMKNFDARLAAELAKHGISPKAADVKPEGEKQLTWTEKAIAAKAGIAK